LFEADHLVAASKLRAEFGSTLGEQAVSDRLGDAEEVTVRGVEDCGCRRRDASELAPCAGILLAVLEEPLQQSALVQNLETARLQAHRAHQLGRLGILLQHQHIDVVEAKLGRQHHSRRTATTDDHVEH
jgi:hypothetical protein